MLLFPIYLSAVSQLCASRKSLQRSVKADRLTEKIDQLEREMDQWWFDYQNRRSRLYRDIENEWTDAKGIYHPKKRHFESDEVAECLIHNELFRMLAALMKAPFLDQDGFIACRAQALVHSANVLSALATVDGQTTAESMRNSLGLSVCLWCFRWRVRVWRIENMRDLEFVDGWIRINSWR
jgi:hypothetical protein